MKHFYLLLLAIFAFGCGGNQPGDKMLDAAANGDVETIKSYLDQGVDINYRNSGIFYSQETACMKAAENGQLDALKFLVEQGADYEMANDGGENPISYAAKKGHFDVVMYLIGKGVDVNYRESNYGMTPLLHAAEYGNVEYIKKLLKKGADRKVKNKDLHTMLSLACFHKQVDAVKYLLKIGSDPNQQGCYGWTNLTWGIFSTDYMTYDIPDNIKEIVDALLAAGADINQKDDDGNTVLIHAAQQDARILIDYLLSKGANPNITNNQGADYLHVLNMKSDENN